MTSTLTLLLVAYLLVVAALSVATALGAPLQRAVQTGVVVSELMLVLLAVLDVAAFLDTRPAEPLVHLGYVVVSVILLPLLLRPLPPDAPAASVRGRNGVVAVACLALVVVLVRQRSTA